MHWAILLATFSYKLRKQLEASNIPRKSEFQCLIGNLINGETDNNTAEEWVNAIDRGGLCHVDEQAYMFFVEIEEEVHDNLKSIPDEKITDGFKAKLMDKISSNEYVKSCWSDIIDESEDDSNVVLYMIKLWITV